MGMIHEADDSRRRVKISVRNLVEFVLRSGDIAIGERQELKRRPCRREQEFIERFKGSKAPPTGLRFF